MGRKENRLRFEAMQARIREDDVLRKAAEKSRERVRIPKEISFAWEEGNEAGEILFDAGPLEEVLEALPEAVCRELLILTPADPKHCGMDAGYGGTSTEAVLGRCTTFMPCLDSPVIREVFEADRNKETFFYSDLCVLIPGILREKGEGAFDVLYFYLPVLQSPRRETADRDAAVVPTADKLREVLYERGEKLLKAAVASGKKCLFLEAFGCDAKYRCDAGITAAVWGELLYRYRFHFREIRFIIEKKELRERFEETVLQRIKKEVDAAESQCYNRSRTKEKPVHVPITI